MAIININKLKTNKKSTIQGFVTSIRNKNNIAFLVIKDISASIQVTIIKSTNSSFNELLDKLTIQSLITITGTLKVNATVKLGGKEFMPTAMTIESLAATPLPLDNTSLIDTRLDYRWVDLRSERNQLIFKVQTILTGAWRNFLVKKNFIEIHTPKLIAAASESGSEVFEISNYFDKKAYLAQSPQFYKQMAIASGFERVFEVGPVFRAEKSRSNRHATEFTGFDLELSGIKDVNELMQFENNLLIEGFKSVNKKYGKDIEQLFNLKLNLPPKKIPVITLPKLFEALASKYQYKVDIKDQTDLTAEGEKLAGQYAQETYQSDFLFVINYSKDVRPFYHLRDKNGIPQGFDLIYRGVEITSGSMREHRYDVLKKQADEKHLSKDVAFYLQFFKYGIAPHGGFGLGLDRVVMLMLGLTIKEACLCFRDPDRLLP